MQPVIKTKGTVVRLFTCICIHARLALS